MQLNLNGKTAIVTGASRGLGYACAYELAREGCELWIASRDERSILRASQQIQQETGSTTHSRTIDFTDPSSVSSFIRHIQGAINQVNIVVVSTGGPAAGPIIDLSDEDWKVAYQLIVLGPVQLVRGIFPLLTPGSSIIFIGASGFKTPLRNSILSNAMRAALVVVVKNLSQELGKEEVRVNAVLPGPFATERILELSKIWSSGQGISIDEAITNRYFNKLNLKRLGDPTELGYLVAFLSSPLASYITGSAITIDGGFTKSLL
jgi:3-oxoacyl-[acyl-carrier protein] reductase